MLIKYKIKCAKEQQHDFLKPALYRKLINTRF